MIERLNDKTFKRNTEYPEKFIQFGEGNFLRAFADWIIHQMNQKLDFNAGVLVIQPRNKDTVYRLMEQDGLYTVLLNGIDQGALVDRAEVVSSIVRGMNSYKEFDAYLMAADNPELQFVLSNTTEAGIAYEPKDKFDDRPPSSFPAKLTRFLYQRYKTFKGDPEKGLYILPCELIDRNGDVLKEIILLLAEDWDLGPEFKNWIEQSNYFYNTLVDRIVPGFPKDKSQKMTETLGYQDDFMVQAEVFHLWVIEGPDHIRDVFPADQAGLNVLFVDDLTPYRDRKVRILNGAHTSMVPVAYLYGLDTVRQALENKVTGEFIRSTIYDEIIPTLDLPENELNQFAEDVLDRFLNPFVAHYLIDISLNSMSKFETRVLPSLLEYYKRKGILPKKLVFSLAALINFYRGKRGEDIIQLKDDQEYLALYEKLWQGYPETNSLRSITHSVLALTDLWGSDLNIIQGLTEQVTHDLELITEQGMQKALAEVIS